MHFLIAYLELTALAAILVILTYAHVEVAMWATFAIFVVATLSLLFGWKPPRITGRLKALMVMFVCFGAAIFIGPKIQAHQEAELAHLRATDVEAYLTALRSQDEVRWLNALKELRPEQYEVEAKRRRNTAQAAYLAECTDDRASTAYVMLQDDVREQLRAPSTADFPGRYEPGTRHLGDCIYQVFGKVDAQNGFGAMLRTSFEGRIQYFPESGGWQTLELKVEG